jgi:hypothetical protein
LYSIEASSLRGKMIVAIALILLTRIAHSYDRA